MPLDAPSPHPPGSRIPPRGTEHGPLLRLGDHRQQRILPPDAKVADEPRDLLCRRLLAAGGGPGWRQRRSRVEVIDEIPIDHEGRGETSQPGSLAGGSEMNGQQAQSRGPVVAGSQGGTRVGVEEFVEQGTAAFVGIDPLREGPRLGRPWGCRGGRCGRNGLRGAQRRKARVPGQHVGGKRGHPGPHPLVHGAGGEVRRIDGVSRGQETNRKRPLGRRQSGGRCGGLRRGRLGSRRAEERGVGDDAGAAGDQMAKSKPVLPLDEVGHGGHRHIPVAFGEHSLTDGRDVAALLLGEPFEQPLHLQRNILGFFHALAEFGQRFGRVVADLVEDFQQHPAGVRRLQQGHGDRLERHRGVEGQPAILEHESAPLGRGGTEGEHAAVSEHESRRAVGMSQEVWFGRQALLVAHDDDRIEGQAQVREGVPELVPAEGKLFDACRDGWIGGQP